MGQGAWSCCCWWWCLLTWCGWVCLWAGDMACVRFRWPCRPSSSGRPPPQPTCHQDSEWSDEGCALQGVQPLLLGPLMVSLQVCACIVATPRMHLRLPSFGLPWAGAWTLHSPCFDSVSGLRRRSGGGVSSPLLAISRRRVDLMPGISSRGHLALAHRLTICPGF